MITFTICLLALILGYFTYGRIIEHIFGPDNRKTPALTMTDGVDYIPMPTWKIFMIQFLNIAGVGPIFGAIMGAMFGTASYVWIVLGSIFAGAVHDYLSGMLSLRNSGESLPELIGRYLGLPTKQVMRVFSVILMMLVGAVFVASPADLLARLTPESLDMTFWIVVIFIYYILATMLPIDKIIGKIYPLFAFALLFMAVGILVMLYIKSPDLPELWEGMQNTHPQADTNPIFPMMFITIACGAISGFHATQSPLMARCMKSERYGRPVFYGAMITEGIVALIWATVATYFFHENGMGLSDASRRSIGHIGRCGGSYHQRRYRFPFGTAHRGRLPGLGTEVYPQTSVHLRTHVFGSCSLVIVQPKRCRRFPNHLALLCMGQPDAGCLHLMGGDGMAGTQQTRTDFQRNLLARHLHDHCLHYLHLCSSRRLKSRYRMDFADSLDGIGHFYRMVQHLVYKG